MKGKFVTFEGCEGSGKSTQLQFLKEYLEKKKMDCIFTREPGGNLVSEKIRSLILDKNNQDMTDECEALLYAAARAQVSERVITPALQQGKMVVCDRFIDSSLAYQGAARGLGLDFVRLINRDAIKNCLPDCTIFLNLDPVAAFARKNGADADDRIEQAGLAFHQKVYDGYLQIAEQEPNRFISIDARDSAEKVFEKVLKVLKDKKIIE